MNEANLSNFLDKSFIKQQIKNNKIQHEQIDSEENMSEWVKILIAKRYWKKFSKKLSVRNLSRTIIGDHLIELIIC